MAWLLDTNGSPSVAKQSFPYYVLSRGVTFVLNLASPRFGWQTALVVFSCNAWSPPASAHLYCVDVRVVRFRGSIAHPAYTPVYASLCRLRQQRKTRGREDRYSFLVRILLCSDLFFRAT
jgi:hypothetical protein